MVCSWWFSKHCPSPHVVPVAPLMMLEARKQGEKKKLGKAVQLWWLAAPGWQLVCGARCANLKLGQPRLREGLIPCLPAPISSPPLFSMGNAMFTKPVGTNKAVAAHSVFFVFPASILLCCLPPQARTLAWRCSVSFMFPPSSSTLSPPLLTPSSHPLFFFSPVPTCSRQDRWFGGAPYHQRAHCCLPGLRL